MVNEKKVLNYPQITHVINNRLLPCFHV